MTPIKWVGGLLLSPPPIPYATPTRKYLWIYTDHHLRRRREGGKVRKILYILCIYHKLPTSHCGSSKYGRGEIEVFPPPVISWLQYITATTTLLAAKDHAVGKTPRILISHTSFPFTPKLVYQSTHSLPLSSGFPGIRRGQHITVESLLPSSACIQMADVMSCDGCHL